MRSGGVVRICYLANAASIHTQRWATHFQSQGHAVTVASLTPAHVPGIDIRRIGHDPNVHGRSAYLAAIPGFRRLLREWRPDLVHAHYAGGYGFVGALSGFHPTVLTAWGSDVLILPKASRLMRGMVRLALRRADLITSMADHMTSAIRALGAPGERVLTLPFGVDTSLFHPRELREPGPAPIILSTRHLEPLYNVGLLVEAMPDIVNAISGVKLILIGEGSERARLEQRVRELNLDRRVVFLGRRRPQEIADYLSRADLFVSTSLSDGNNISLNEAMACGVFPIATDIAANHEWIRHGENGLLTDLHDPCTLAGLAIHALSRPELRAQAATLNWEIIQTRGSWAAAMKSMEHHYRSLLRKGAPAASIRLAAGI